MMETSNDISTGIISLFTNASLNPSSIKEDFSEVKVAYVFDIQRIPIKDDYTKIIDKLNARDSFHLSVLKDNEIVGNFTNRTSEKFEHYITTLSNTLDIGNNIEIVLTVEKNKKENTLSIYYLDEFANYLKSLSFLTFLNVVEKHLGKEKLILESQEDTIDKSIFKTQTILIKNKNFDSEIDKIESQFRDSRTHSATTFCHWDIEKKSLLPEDLYPIVKEQTNQELLQVFQKTCLLYTTMFIFDYLGIKEKGFSYKLNGYKTFGEEIITQKIDDINIDFSSIDLLYKIYQWIYTGGNTNDKISIARNIISLNYNPQTLELSKTSFDAILSNYKIYERQNVKQYIDVRNKLSEILIDLQGKIDKIVDGFISDYKKNIITLISFFISVIAIRVVSKGDFIGGFTNEIIVLSVSFLLISLGVLIYSRWEFTQRASMFDKHYDQLKERYKELLSEEELNKIFDQCSPKNKKTKSFVQQQKKFYSILWICSIIVLGIAMIIIYFINNNGAYCPISSFLKFVFLSGMKNISL